MLPAPIEDAKSRKSVQAGRDDIVGKAQVEKKALGFPLSRNVAYAQRHGLTQVGQGQFSSIEEKIAVAWRLETREACRQRAAAGAQQSSKADDLAGIYR